MAQYDHNPPIIEKYNMQGQYIFRFNIVETEDESNNPIWQCDEVIAQTNTREAIITAMVRKRYTAEQEFAIQRKKIAGEEGSDAEFTEYNDYVNFCKQTAVI